MTMRSDDDKLIEHANGENGEPSGSDAEAILKDKAREIKKREKRNLIINIALLIIIVVLVVMIVVDKYVITRMVVSGPSMLPTLEDGQHIAVRITKEAEKGDIIVFTHDDKFVVKRVIATAGDHVKIDARGNVFVNGNLLDEPYINEHLFYANEWDRTLADDEYFVLGDNRNNSYDSEDYGPIKKDTVFGKLR